MRLRPKKSSHQPPFSISQYTNMLGQSAAGTIESSIDIVAKLQNESNILNSNLDTSSWDRSLLKFYPFLKQQPDSSIQDYHDQNPAHFDRFFIQTKANLISCFAADSNHDSSYSVEFLSKIELVQILQESNILILGERRGVLHFMNSSTGHILHSQQISDADAQTNTDVVQDEFAGVAVGKSKEGTKWDVLIAMTSGLLVRLLIPILIPTENPEECFEQVR